MLGRETEFEEIKQLKEDLKEIKTALKDHDHKDGKVLVEY